MRHELLDGIYTAHMQERGRDQRFIGSSCSDVREDLQNILEAQ